MLGAAVQGSGVTITHYCGDALAVLRTLPSDSVHMICTSPPYWGLRDYKVEPQLWSGDQTCEHEWGATIAVNATNHTDKRRWQHTRNGRDEEQPTEKRVAWLRTKVPQGQFCQRCGAWAGSLGLEPTPVLFIEHIVEVFREVRRVLRPDGTLWLNMGDGYTSGGRATWRSGASQNKGQHILNDMPRPAQPEELKPKDLMMMPARVALALQADGWWLRSEIIWAKPNPMPESILDRPTSSHEKVFLLTKAARYFYDNEAVREPMTDASVERYEYAFGGPKNELLRATTTNRTRVLGNRKPVKIPGGWDTSEGAHGTINRDGPTSAQYQEAETSGSRNLRNVWTMPTEPFPGSHFATMPTALVERCILAGTSAHGCCPACGAPWARIVHRGEPDIEHQGVCGGNAAGEYTGHSTKGHDAAGVQNASDVKRRILAGLRERTSEWQPTCKCERAGVVPCTVLDPFAGAFTVSLVAERLRRDSLAIELNPDYVRMGLARCGGDAPLLTTMTDGAAL